MPRNREFLNALDDERLVLRTLDVRWISDSRQYVLHERIGRGQTGVAWRAQDTLGRDFALKFVLRQDYETHSLDAETRRANSLQSRLFAKIDFFGEISFPDNGPACDDYYAIVVQWVQGRSLTKFLNDPSTSIGPDAFQRLARDLCEVLQSLKECQLCHSDLHGENVLVRLVPDALLATESLELVVIDTGQLKTEARRQELLEQWHQALATVQGLNLDNIESVNQAEKELQGRIAYFNRTDQEWIVHHLCMLYNRMRNNLAYFDPVEKRFIRDLPQLLRTMIDPDPSRRIDEPRVMHSEIIRLFAQCSQSPKTGMLSPFDLPSAELILNDRQLMALFSDEYPRLEACRSIGPVYLYGPRGCGKSTVLRSLSLRAILESPSPAEEFAKNPFVGVYISASQELRSRFLLMREEDLEVLEGHIVRYFNLLLLESLADTLDAAFASSRSPNFPIRFNLSNDVASKCASETRKRLNIDPASGRYAGVSHLNALRDDIRRMRDGLWVQILDRQTTRNRVDAQLLFDVCRALEQHWPFLKEHRVVFLIDDYSNQRIPVGLQKRLNQAITFSKQGSPIFKVTSEYDGVDLEGVQEGREVHEVNIGFEYLSLQHAKRYRFLQSVLERRFAYLDQTVNLLDVLPLSEVEPATAMAREIRAAFDAKRRFLYNGLDTLSDLCSGDFAMGLDLVRRIFESARVDWRAPRRIPPVIQDGVIREYAKHEFEHIRYQSRDGRIKYDIADRLCWFSKECILTKDSTKDGRTVPIVKNHIDISELARRQLQEQYPEKAAILNELVSRGVLFPIQPSRTRQGRDATYRVMVRRILLARYTTALGRDQPIRIDDVQRLQTLLTEPQDFVKSELARTAPERNSPPKQNVATQHTLGFGDPEDEDA